jgi:hypothetical protein
MRFAVVAAQLSSLRGDYIETFPSHASDLFATSLLVTSIADFVDYSTVPDTLAIRLRSRRPPAKVGRVPETEAVPLLSQTFVRRDIQPNPTRFQATYASVGMSPWRRFWFESSSGRIQLPVQPNERGTWS